MLAFHLLGRGDDRVFAGYIDLKQMNRTGQSACLQLFDGKLPLFRRTAAEENVIGSIIQQLRHHLETNAPVRCDFFQPVSVISGLSVFFLPPVTSITVLFILAQY